MRLHLKYTIASNPGSYQAAHALLRKEGFPKSILGFPTILAWEGNELIGFCGTRIYEQKIMAGPLVVRTDRRRLFTIMRLCEAYEAAMRNLGITTFIIGAEIGSILSKGIRRYSDTKPYAVDDEYEYFIWKVGEYGRQGISPESDGRGETPSEEPSGTAGSPEGDDRAAEITERSSPSVPG